MPTLIHRRVRAARAGQNPMVLARLRSGWAVIGDHQLLPGYSLLLPDPVVPDLNALTGPARAVFLEEMAALGDALLAATDAERINYEILGNTEPALHAHLFPRYGWEEPALRAVPVWEYGLRDAKPRFDPERDRPLMDRIRQALAANLPRVEVPG